MDAELEKIKKLYPGYDDVEIKPTSFGERLRQIRKERGETQDEFAARIGTSKQVLSRYESGQRIPKISLAEKYAQALSVSVDYLMGKNAPQEAAFDSVCTQSDKPFYKIFIDVTTEMNLLIPDIVRITGLTDWQVRTIIFRRMKEAPLPIALQLSERWMCRWRSGQATRNTKPAILRWRPARWRRRTIGRRQKKR